MRYDLALGSLMCLWIYSLYHVQDFFYRLVGQLHSANKERNPT